MIKRVQGFLRGEHPSTASIGQNWQIGKCRLRQTEIVSMSPSPSPMVMSKKPDGSTDKIYAQNGRDNGFAVIDFGKRLPSAPCTAICRLERKAKPILRTATASLYRQ